MYGVETGNAKGEMDLDENNMLGFFANDSVPLGMAYVPFQKWRMLYEEDVGFERGTVFKELDKPFIGEEAVK